MVDLPAVVNILGSQVTVECRTEEQDPRIRGISGFYDWTTHSIVLEDMVQGESLAEIGNYREYMNKVLRHEVIHAFMQESGLHEAATFDDSHFEQMVDWVAIQYPKIQKVFNELGV